MTTPELIPLISRAQIQQRIRVVAAQISRDYNGRNLVLIGILKGAFVFLADLARSLNIPHQIDFIRAASYGAGAVTSGDVRVTFTPELDLKDKDVLLVEDIVDTGLTLAYLVSCLQRHQPASVKICALLDKTERRARRITVDYACFAVKEGFLVGYGLDYNEDYRHLRAVFQLRC